MKIDTRIVLKDYDGKPLTYQEEDGKEEKVIAGQTVEVPKIVTKEVTIKYVLMIVATSTVSNEVLVAEKKARLHEIATKCVITHEPNITDTEISLIMERVDKIWPSSVVIYGRIKDLFGTKEDPKPAPVTNTPAEQIKEMVN